MERLCGKDAERVDRLHTACECDIAFAQLVSNHAIVQATVLLNANVAYLTISNVTPGPKDPTAAQVASLVSIIASIGSMILGSLLGRQHRSTAKQSASDAVHVSTSERTFLIIFTI